MSDQRQIFTLKQVVSSIRKTLEERYQQLYWVKAEMHKLNRYPSGHCFPELLQKEDGKLVAQMNGSIWKHNFERINQRFIEVVKEPLKEDSTLLMQVKITFHEIYGMSLQILDIDPNYALGELHKERAETLRKLKAEGLLNANQNLPFPLLPKRIAVISAESSKGLSDFNKVLDQNTWGYQYFRMLFPAYLQGDLAAASIISAMEKIKKVRHHFDVVVIVRGGGGEVGLSCYNNYELCRVIASFPLPVLTGIGHSTNMTVAEMIAFRNSITPTELGEFFIQSFHNFSVPLKDAMKSLRIFSLHILGERKHRLTAATQHFQYQTKQLLKGEQHLVSSLTVTLRTSLKYRFLRMKEQVNRQELEVSQEGRHRLEKESGKLSALQALLIQSGKQSFREHANKVIQLEQSIRLMDPVNVLKRGYSITTFKGSTISEMNTVNKGDRVQTRTANFILESTIDSIKQDHE